MTIASHISRSVQRERTSKVIHQLRQQPAAHSVRLSISNEEWKSGGIIRPFFDAGPRSTSLENEYPEVFPTSFIFTRVLRSPVLILSLDSTRYLK